MKRAVAAAAALGGLLALAGVARRAEAHTSSLTYGELDIDDTGVTYVLKLEARDLYEGLGLDKDRPATRDEALAGQARLAAYVLAKVAVTRRGDPCTATARPLGFEDSADGFYAVLTFDYACPLPLDQIGLRYDLFFELDKLHEGRIRISWRARGEKAPRTQAAWFRFGERSFAWERPGVGAAASDSEAGSSGAGSGLVAGARAALRLDHVALVLALAAACAAAGLARTSTSTSTSTSANTSTSPSTAARSRRVALLALAGAGLGLAVGLAFAAIAPALAARLATRAGLLLCAASAAWLAVEDLVLVRPPASQPTIRSASALGFGLVHGASLAGVLAAGSATAHASITTLAGAWLALTLAAAALALATRWLRTRTTALALSTLALASAAGALLL